MDLPPVIFGTSGHGNLFVALEEQEKLKIVEQCVCISIKQFIALPKTFLHTFIPGFSYASYFRVFHTPGLKVGSPVFNSVRSHASLYWI